MCVAGRKRFFVWAALGLAVIQLGLPAAARALGESKSERPSAVESEDAADRTSESATGPDGPEPRLTVDWYGYVKLDSSWDDSLVDAGNFARWVTSPSVVDDHSHFNMTARQTRLGVALDHRPSSGPPVRARVEIDFYGGGAENKNQPQLRHAYFDLLWPERGWSLRAGQTSDVISPLAPTTLNYTVGWWVGNLGYRRPIARLSKTAVSEDGAETQFVVALSRTIGDDFGAPEPGDSGADSGVPTVQASAARSWPTGHGRLATVGVSGHWGRERLEETRARAAPEFDSWSANLHLRLPAGARGTLEAEAWTGENLDDYFGGIGQGIAYARGVEIEAAGGWLSYKSQLRPDLLASIGTGIDDPEDEPLPSGARSRNQAAWANLLWDFRPALQFGAEASWWQTGYVALEDADSLRLQISLIYNFGS